MATDKSFASQGSAATLSMLKSLPAMVDTSAPHGEGGAFFWLVVPLPSGLLQFGESDKHFLYICHEKSVRCERSLQHLNLMGLHNPTFAQPLRFGDYVLELIVVAGNMASIRGIVNALLWSELYLFPNLYFIILISSTSEYDCVSRQIL